MQIIEKSKSLLQQPIKPRERYYQQLEQYLATDQIVVVQGQRRVGKSYVIMGYLQQLNLDSNQIFFLNKELDEENMIPDSTALIKLYEDYCKSYGIPKYLIIDEIQDIQGRESFIRARFVEKQSKIIISGSNSQFLSGELATYLTGRYLSFQVFPLSYEEYCLFTQQADSRTDFKTLLQSQTAYLRKRNLVYRGFFTTYFEMLLKTEEVIIIQ